MSIENFLEEQVSVVQFLTEIGEIDNFTKEQIQEMDLELRQYCLENKVNFKVKDISNSSDSIN
jgi:hypothetical protein